MKTLTAEELNARDTQMHELVNTSNVRNERGDRITSLKPVGRDADDFLVMSKQRLRQLLNDAYAAGMQAQGRE